MVSLRASTQQPENAPWMKIAFREGRQWYGKKEGVIGKTDNYFKLLKGSSVSRAYNTMEGTTSAWCAAFANYCLQEAGYKKVTASDGYEIVRAKGFSRDTRNFKKIHMPAYGALALSGNHICFVAGLVNKTHFYRLGGNQNDKITIGIRSIASHKFFLPFDYYNENRNVTSQNLTFHSAPIISESNIKVKGVFYEGRKKASSR